MVGDVLGLVRSCGWRGVVVGEVLWLVRCCGWRGVGDGEVLGLEKPSDVRLTSAGGVKVGWRLADDHRVLHSVRRIDSQVRQ